MDLGGSRHDNVNLGSRGLPGVRCKALHGYWRGHCEMKSLMSSRVFFWSMSPVLAAASAMHCGESRRRLKIATSVSQGWD